MIYFPVRNQSDARLAWYIIHDYKNRPEKVEDLKREVREYMTAGPNVEEFRIVKDYGIDGAISLEVLPETLPNLETAAKWFEVWRVIPANDSCGYDCTGTIFTSWFKVFERNGRFWAYHRVARDV